MSSPRLTSSLVALVSTLLLVEGCAVPRISSAPSPQLMGLRIAAETKVTDAAKSLSSTTTPDAIDEFITNEVALARLHLNADATLKTLGEHQETQTHFKWANIALSVVTTVVGSVAADQTGNKKPWGEITVGLGAVTTAFIAIRDDKDLATRIATCQTVLQSGEKEIDAFQATYVVQRPATTGAADVAKFLSDLSAAAAKMIGDVDLLNGTCS